MIICVLLVVLVIGACFIGSANSEYTKKTETRYEYKKRINK